jgi:hypothetical protein
MKKNSRMLTMLILLLLFISLACKEENEARSAYHVDDIGVSPDTPRSGQVTGTEDEVYSQLGLLVSDQHSVTCTDGTADYQLTISTDSKLPTDTHLTGSIQGQYFRLDATTVQYLLLDENHCNYDVNPSDYRVHTIIEGSYDPATYKFTILTCGNSGEPAESEIYQTSADHVSGTVVCKKSDQLKSVFRFAELILK